MGFKLYSSVKTFSGSNLSWFIFSLPRNLCKVEVMPWDNIIRLTRRERKCRCILGKALQTDQNSIVLGNALGSEVCVGLVLMEWSPT